MIYTYLCEACEDTFQKELSVEDRYNPTKKRCKKCGEWAIIKTINSVYFRVHGMCAANGYNNVIGDIEKFTGKPYEQEE